MATAESVKAKLQGLIDSANAATGNTDADLTAAVSALISGFGPGGGPGSTMVERGSIVADSTRMVSIPCSFEPDIVFFKRAEPISAEGDVRCAFTIAVIQNILSCGKYIANDGGTAATNGTTADDISGYGASGLSYADQMLSGGLQLNGRHLAEGYSYNYILGRCGL